MMGDSLFGIAVRACALLFATALLADACASAAGAPRDTSLARGPAGCYRFDAAYFSVIGRDSSTRTVVSLATAELILLESPPPAMPYGQAPYAVRPIPFALDSLTSRRWMANSGWMLLPGDSIQVSWRNGLFGPVFRLAVRGDSLQGTVVHTTDVANRPIRRGPAAAVRMRCPEAALTR